MYICTKIYVILDNALDIYVAMKSKNWSNAFYQQCRMPSVATLLGPLVGRRLKHVVAGFELTIT